MRAGQYFHLSLYKIEIIVKSKLGLRSIDRMTRQNFFWLFFVALCAVSSQTLFKVGFINDNFGFDFQTVKHIITTPILLISVTLYWFSLVVRGRVIVSLNFTVATTLLSTFVFITTLFFGFFLFNENMNITKILGILFVLLGIILITFKGKVKLHPDR